MPHTYESMPKAGDLVEPWLESEGGTWPGGETTPFDRTRINGPGVVTRVAGFLFVRWTHPNGTTWVDGYFYDRVRRVSRSGCPCGICQGVV